MKEKECKIDICAQETYSESVWPTQKTEPQVCDICGYEQYHDETSSSEDYSSLDEDWIR